MMMMMMMMCLSLISLNIQESKFHVSEILIPFCQEYYDLRLLKN